MSAAAKLESNGSSGPAARPDVGDGLSASGARWSFGGETSRSFDSHVARSVPLYRRGHGLILQLSDFFLSSGSTCYDLGCSTGLLARKLARRHQGRGIRFVGIDAEPGMVAFARSRGNGDPDVEFVRAAIERFAFEPADLVISYYTMQFITPKDRQGIFDRVYQALNPGGALILFEKVHAEDAQFQDVLSQLLADRKLSLGFTPDQIVNKSRSLKGVLRPYSTATNLECLARAGFAASAPIIKYLSFEGILAIK
jgi:tRNA (cmo5U34)-methyltransferase